MIEGRQNLTICKSTASRDEIARTQDLVDRLLQGALRPPGPQDTDASETMARNSLLPAVVEGIEAFVGKKRRRA
jgi:hypothetical protein